MLILDSPGRHVGYIHCRTCRRCVHVDPEMFPPGPISEGYRARLRCSKCGGRGADIQIGWTTPRAPPAAVSENVTLPRHAELNPDEVSSITDCF
jgi:hypothetical protein